MPSLTPLTFQPVMTEFGHLPRGEDTDLLCVEVSALGQAAAAPMPAALPKVSRSGWQQQQQQQHEEAEEEQLKNLPMSSADQAHEDFLTSMLLKTDAYCPLQTSLLCMEDPGENSSVLRAAIAM